MKSKIIYKVYYESGPLKLLIHTYTQKPAAFQRAEDERKKDKEFNKKGYTESYIVAPCLSHR